MAALRICKRCQKALALKDFKKDQSLSTMRRSICKACSAMQSKEYRARRKAALASDSVQTIAIISDAHVPEHDRRFWDVFLLWLRNTRPDEVVINGDFGEFSSVSQHGGANETKLEEDLTEVRAALRQIRQAIGPDARMTYLEGNHESRLPRALASWAPTVASSLDLPAMLKLEEQGITWVPEYRQPIRRGNLRVLHGHQVLGKYGPKNHAAKAADVYGSQPGVEIVYGHVHASQHFVKPVAGGALAATSSGCGRTIGAEQVRWLAGREAGWHHGFVVAYIHREHAQVYGVKVCNGQFVWNGKVYDARPAKAG